MNNAVTEIKNYILYLKKKCLLQITLHSQGDERLISGSKLILFNIHENPHCVYVKTFQKVLDHCVGRQCKIAEKCKNGSFSGTCYTGVFEYVYPVFDSISVACFICVSGYRGANYEEYIKKCAADYSIPLSELEKTSGRLKAKILDKAAVDTFIIPLVRCWSLPISPPPRRTAKPLKSAP